MGEAELVKEPNLTSISKADGIVDVILRSPPATQTPPSSIGPATPDSNRQPHLDFSSPLTVTTETTNSQTPKSTLFDSFASPSTDKLMLAPHHNKYKFFQKQGSFVGVVRRLTFPDVVATVRREESMISDEQQEEEDLFQIVYTTIVDAIVSEQQQLQNPESPRTPPESCLEEKQCPGAPIKPKNKYSRINLILDSEICRRLEF